MSIGLSSSCLFPSLSPFPVSLRVGVMIISWLVAEVLFPQAPLCVKSSHSIDMWTSSGWWNSVVMNKWDGASARGPQTLHANAESCCFPRAVPVERLMEVCRDAYSNQHLHRSTPREQKKREREEKQERGWVGESQRERKGSWVAWPMLIWRQIILHQPQ